MKANLLFLAPLGCLLAAGVYALSASTSTTVTVPRAASTIHARETGVVRSTTNGTAIEADTRAAEAPLAQEQPTEPWTVRSELADYWGDDWSAVRDRLLAAGKDLDAPFSMIPREEAEPRLEELIGISDDDRLEFQAQLAEWPIDLSEDRLREETGYRSEISPELLAECQQVGDTFTPELLRCTDAFLAELDVALKMEWPRAKANMVPYSTKSLAKEQSPPGAGVAFHSCAHGFGGWAVKLNLYRNDHPSVYQRYVEILDANTERKNALIETIRTRTGH